MVYFHEGHMASSPLSEADLRLLEGEGSRLYVLVLEC